MFVCREPIRLLKPREMLNHCPDWFAALIAATTISLASGARAQIGGNIAPIPRRATGAFP